MVFGLRLQILVPMEADQIDDVSNVLSTISDIHEDHWSNRGLAEGEQPNGKWDKVIR